MDKYIEAANKVIEQADRHNWIKCQGILAHCAHRDAIADALRESAAQAYEGAADMMLTSMPAKAHTALKNRAKTLRSVGVPVPEKDDRGEDDIR